MKYNVKGGVDHIRVALNYVTDFRIAIDGGAHEGVILSLIREKFERVYAFEPGPLPLVKLRERVSGWGNVVLHEAALGSRAGMVWFGNDGQKTRSRSWFADPERTGDTVMMRIDDLGLPTLGFLKLDIEGGELAALIGGRSTIERCRPVIVLETAITTFKRSHDSGGVRLFGFLESMGYRAAEKFERDTVFVG